MIFMVFQADFYREFSLPNCDNMDYQIFIDKTCFNVDKSFNILLEVINHRWNIYSDNKYYEMFMQKEQLDCLSLNGGEIITLKPVGGDTIKIITFDTEIALMAYKKYSLTRTKEITVGKEKENTVRYEFMNLVSKHHCSIIKKNERFYICDFSRNGVFVNSDRINKEKKLDFGDIVDIFGLKMVFLGNILAVGTRVGKYEVYSGLEEYDVPITDGLVSREVHNDVYFNRSPRVFPAISSEKIIIEPPTMPQVSKKRSTLSIIGPSFTMAIPMLLGCGIAIIGTSLSGGTTSAFMFTGIITALGSGIMGATWGLYNLREAKRNEVAEETQRFNLYGNYLIELASYIKDKYKHNMEAMFRMYPSADDCCSYDESSPDLWNRNVTHDDFLFCRLGVGDIPFQVDIQIPKEKFTVVHDFLKDKPTILYENFRTLRDVPVGVDFGENNIYGIAGGKYKRGVYDIVDAIIAQIIANTSYTDVKIAFCYDKEADRTGRWDYIKWLPHVWSENKSMRYYATDKQEIADVFFELSNIMRHRSEVGAKSIGKKNFFKPHYFLFISDASFFDGELIGKYILDKKNDYGMTTIIMTDYYQNLPNECENIIQNDEVFQGVYSVQNQARNVCNIHYDKVNPYRLEQFAKRISGIEVREVEDDAGIVSALDFFEMYGAGTLEDFRIEERWRKNRTYNSMRALVGKKSGGADCYLDIHEKYHGPHGLVAGTTGSGKSELMQTFMLSLAINYSPDDIAFFVIDFKGGGMANLFSDLPHMAGQISNLSGNQIGRAMISIKSENLRRQRIFNEFGVNNINLYTRLYKSGEASAPIPHLIIIIDEFAELKREEPDFMRELISVAQVGRSLGVHLILATQKPSGTVDDNIWSNAKFRLCLRVQDRQDSNDMLHKPDAAYITQAGRCYLQVGNDEIYELFQSGWSGAVYDDSSESTKSEIATMITPTGKTAVVGGSTKKKQKELKKRQWYKFLLRQFLAMNNDNSFESSEQSPARQMISAAQAHGYNIGTSNSDIQAMQNFLELITDTDGTVDERVSAISEFALKNNIKLPEIKEKNQLEAVVEYIKGVAAKEHYVKKSQLWMPLLAEEIPLNTVSEITYDFAEISWKNYENWTLDAVVGLYDDPQNQSQLPFSVNFAEGGHLAVCGSSSSGKSTFVQTLIFSLAIKYSPSHINFYIMDFSSGMLSVFEQLPHTGGVVKENSIDKIGKFFNMMSSIIDERKKLFNGGNYTQFVKANGIVVPSIVIVIDNFAGFKEKTNNAFEENLIHLAREGVGYGVFLVLTSAGFGMAEIQNRIGDNIKTVLSLEMGDKFKYMDVLKITRISVMPEAGVKGRGIGFVEGRLLEFQTAVAVSAEDDYKRNNEIEKICQTLRTTWNGECAPEIPYIPENPTFDEFGRLAQYDNCIKQTELLPFGYKFEDASVYCVNLVGTYCFSVTGKRRTGKTNLLKILIMAAAKKKARNVIIEKESNELKSLAAENGFEYLSSDAEILQYFKNITETFISRNKQKRELSEQGLSDAEIFEKMQSNIPIFIFVADLAEFVHGIYHPEGNIKNMSGFFENIFEKGQLHNIFFFGCINTDEVSSMAGLKAYQTFVSYKTGVHLGGNVAAQRIFNFQNIHYSQMSKQMKKGEALSPSHDDDTQAEKVIIPLIGGKSV